MDTNFQVNAGVKKVKGERLMSPDYVAQVIVKCHDQAGSRVQLIGRNSWIFLICARLFGFSFCDRIWWQLSTRLR